MRIYRGFDERVFREIAKASGNRQTEADVKYERFVQVHQKNRVYAERIDTDAFLIGYEKSESLRIVGMATRKEKQGLGYGTKLLMRCIKYCMRMNIPLIETRTKAGYTFYREKAGARVVGMKAGDYLMEIDVPHADGGGKRE